MRSTCASARGAIDRSTSRPGAFRRRSARSHGGEYGAGNPLIGYPLAYQYLTAVRPDALPASTDDVLRMRARGWRPSYPIGSLEVAPGLPLMTAFRWDTGVQVRVGPGVVQCQRGAHQRHHVRPEDARQQRRKADRRPRPLAANTGARHRRLRCERCVCRRRRACRPRHCAPGQRDQPSRRLARTPSTRAITGCCAAS